MVPQQQGKYRGFRKWPGLGCVAIALRQPLSHRCGLWPDCSGSLQNWQHGAHQEQLGQLLQAARKAECLCSFGLPGIYSFLPFFQHLCPQWRLVAVIRRGCAASIPEQGPAGALGSQPGVGKGISHTDRTRGCVWHHGALPTAGNSFHILCCIL